MENQFQIVDEKFSKQKTITLCQGNNSTELSPARQSNSQCDHHIRHSSYSLTSCLSAALHTALEALDIAAHLQKLASQNQKGHKKISEHRGERRNHYTQFINH